MYVHNTETKLQYRTDGSNYFYTNIMHTIVVDDDNARAPPRVCTQASRRGRVTAAPILLLLL